MARSSIQSAGFYPQYLWSMREDLDKIAGFSIVDVTRTLSTFHLEWLHSSVQPDEPKDGRTKHAVEIYRDLLSRGLPTLAPLFVERTVLEPLFEAGLAEEDETRGAIQFRPPDTSSSLFNQWQSVLIDAHVVVDPRLSPNDMDSGLFGSDEEEVFFNRYLPDAVGDGALQFCELQTPLEELLPNEEAVRFLSQQVDFFLPLSSTEYILEVDGAQHLAEAHQKGDARRDQALTDTGRSVIRVPTNQIADQSWPEALGDSIARDTLAQRANERMTAPLWRSDLGLAALHVVLAPFSVARLQLALLDAVNRSALSLEAARWQITVIERDVSCAVIAVVDFCNQLEVFYSLLGIDQILPTIDLRVMATPEFSGANYGSNEAYLQERRIRVEYADLRDGLQLDGSTDLLIDIAVLQRHGYNRISVDTNIQGISSCGAALEVRSANSFQDVRRVSALDPVAYEITDQSLPSLEYVLRNVFRKASFRDGQLRILKRALALQPVIGLLPTGGGKSLCYQLAALLQPGMTLVIDPLISLILDQTENLREVTAIDWQDGISSIQSAAEKATAARKMESGSLKYLFLSPERLQNKTFRQQLHHFSIAYAVSYAVIDEAHCVSEWGHDFRTAYLRLADTIREHTRRGNYEPTIMALTGTASLAVLSDVQREIGVTDEDAQVYPETFDRSELKFRVVQTASPNKDVELYTILQQHLPNALDTPWTDLFVARGPHTKAGILFTPHAKGKFGASDLSFHLQNQLNAPVRFFVGKSDKETKTAAQTGFKHNNFTLLAATKAFGMGIDKPNIRYTVHYNIPPSLEAFYQEAGRAGRDQEDAWCWLIFSDDKAAAADRALDPDMDLSLLKETVSGYGGGDVHRLLWLHSNSFRGLDSELQQVKSLYQSFIGRALLDHSEDEFVDVIVPFNDISTKDETTRTERDRALYRLSILGLVQDYTLDYGKEQFEVIAVRLTDEALVVNLQGYIGRYKTREAVEAIPARVTAAPGNTVLSKCLTVLLEFVYAEIEKKRRAALRSMVEVARRASKYEPGHEQDSYVRGELLAYLEESPFTRPLEAIAQEIEPDEWVRILDLRDTNGVLLLSTVDGARHLLGGCRRALESYLDHPGLLYLSSLARRLLPDQDGSAASAEIRRSFRGLREMPIDRQVSAVQTMVAGYRMVLGDTLEAREAQQSIASIALEELSSRALARALATIIPMQSEQVILNHIMTDARLLNRRLRAV